MIDEVIETHGGCLDAFQTKARNPLELAYCLTVHKTQGSEFGHLRRAHQPLLAPLQRALVHGTDRHQGPAGHPAQDQMGEVAAETVEFPDHESVALPQGAQAAVESRSVVAYAGSEVVVEVGRRRRCPRPPSVALQVQRLGAIRLWDAGVARMCRKRSFETGERGRGGC